MLDLKTSDDRKRIPGKWLSRLKGARLSGRLSLPLLSIIVGVISGLGALFFDKLLYLALRLFITLPSGYREPSPGALLTLAQDIPTKAWVLLFIPILGGLVSGLVVYLIAPEAEGHGTDAMIEAFHYHGGYMRRRVPFVKILASALTIGTGGSAGKEGPIAQIGSGFGSFLASVLQLKPRTRRILLLAGAASGIGAIFHAPLGAALFAPEVLYRETELEYEAILPCIVASIVADSIFWQIDQRPALFFPGPVQFDLVELVPYLIFGVVCAVVGFIYIKIFYGMRDHLFHRVPLPNIFKPALGGIFLGLIIYYFPQVMATGYGWVQMAMEGKLLWGTMLLLALFKILATSCTISSGGSGGVFGPSVFIGAMLGGAFGFFGHKLAPGWVIHPDAFVLVGIGGFFAGVAKVPIASIIMACEMSSSYNLLVPLMLVAATSFLLLGKTSLYEKQLVARIASPAHLSNFARSLLQKLYVKDAVTMKAMTAIPEDLPFPDLVKLVTKSSDMYYPVVNQDAKLTGILSINDLREIIFEPGISQLILAKDVATTEVLRVFPEDTLQDALDKMSRINTDELPVVRPEAPDETIGMISKRDIISYYHEMSGTYG
jgi:CIC family chloride channel protein